MTIETYRIRADGTRVGPVLRRTVQAVPDPERVIDSLSWPPGPLPALPDRVVGTCPEE